MKKIALTLILSLIVLTGCIGGGPGESNKKSIESINLQNLSETQNGIISYNNIDVNIEDMGGFDKMHFISESDITKVNGTISGGNIITVSNKQNIKLQRETYNVVGENKTGYYLVEKINLEQETENENNNGSTEPDKEDEEDDSGGVIEIDPSKTRDNILLEYTDDSTWLVVNPDNSNNYNSIEAAIESAHPYFNILVYPGSYTGFTVDKPVDIIGLKDGVNINTGVDTGINIDNEHDKVLIDGLRVTGNYNTGIDISRNSRVEIKNTVVEGSEIGIDAVNTFERWELNNVVVRNGDIGINANQAFGYPVIKNTRSTSNRVGISLYDSIINENNFDMIDVSGNVDYGIRGSSSKDQSLGTIWYNKSARNNLYIKGIARVGEICEVPGCSNSIDNNPTNISRLREYEGEDPPRHLEMDFGGNMNGYIRRLTDGDILVVNGDQDVDTVRIDKDIKIVGNDKPTLNGSNDPYCVEIADSAEPIIYNMEFECGIDAKDTSENWEVINSNLKDNTVGIFATSSTGNWKVFNSEIENMDYGIWASRSTGSYMVYDNDIKDSNIGLRVDSVQTKSDSIIVYNNFINNKKDIRARGNPNSIDVKVNWWGNDGLTFVTASTIQSSIKCNVKNCTEQRKNPFINKGKKLYNRK